MSPTTLFPGLPLDLAGLAASSFLAATLLPGGSEAVFAAVLLNRPEAAGAALMIEDWIDQVGFVALGTNDLLASALGLDRDNPVGSGPADLLHPGLLRLIHRVVTVAHGAGRPVTVCGEMAADPDGIVALAALEVDALSVPVGQLAATRRVLASQPRARLAEELPRLRSAEEVKRLLRA